MVLISDLVWPDKVEPISVAGLLNLEAAVHWFPAFVPSCLEQSDTDRVQGSSRIVPGVVAEVRWRSQAVSRNRASADATHASSVNPASPS